MAPQVHPPALDVGFLARSLTQTQSWKLSELDPKAQSPWDQKEPLAHTQRGSRPSDPLPGPPPSQEGGNTDRSHSLRPNPKLRAEGGGREGQQEPAADTATPTPAEGRRTGHTPAHGAPARGAAPHPHLSGPRSAGRRVQLPGKQARDGDWGSPPARIPSPRPEQGGPSPHVGPASASSREPPPLAPQPGSRTGRGRTKAQRGAGWRAMMPWEGKLGEPAGDPTQNPTHRQGPGQQEDTVILPKKRLNSARRCWRH